MTALILPLIEQGLKLAVLLFGNAMIAKWLGAWKFYLETKLDPALAAEMLAEYRRIDADARKAMNKDEPLP